MYRLTAAEYAELLPKGAPTSTLIASAPAAMMVTVCTTLSTSKAVVHSRARIKHGRREQECVGVCERFSMDR